MKEESMMEDVVLNIIKEATEHSNHSKCLERLQLLEESENYEEVLAMTLHRMNESYVHVAQTVFEVVCRHSFCQFLGKLFSHVSGYTKRFLKLQGIIMRIVLSWDCNLRDSQIALEDSLECDIECLSFVLPIIGKNLEEAFPSRLEELVFNIRDKVLSESLPRNLRSRLLDLLLLKYSGWKLKTGAMDTLNFDILKINGCKSKSEGNFTPDTPNLSEPSRRNKEVDCLLTPSDFAKDQNLDISYSQYNADTNSSHHSATNSVSPLCTMQRTAPNACVHPQPPSSWLFQNELKEPNKNYSTVPTNYIDANYSQPVIMSSDSKVTPESLPTLRNTELENTEQYNGARPKTKLFPVEDDISSSDSNSPRKFQPYVPPPLRLHYQMGSPTSFEHLDKRTPSAFQRSNVISDKAKEENIVTANLHKKHENDTFNSTLRSVSPEPVKKQSPVRNDIVDNSSDEDDIIVEKEPPKGTRKKTKWKPLKTTDIINIPPVKQSIEVTREFDPSNHPFLTSQRICSICGSVDHITSACTKSLRSAMFLEDN